MRFNILRINGLICTICCYNFFSNYVRSWYLYIVYILISLNFSLVVFIFVLGFDNGLYVEVVNF